MAWSTVLAELERDPAISRASFAAWLRGTQLLRVERDEYVVGAQHSFALEKLERSFRGAMEGALRRVAGPQVSLRLVVAREAAAPRAKDAPAPLPMRPAAPLGGSAANRPRSPAPRLLGQLRPGATFDTFQVGRRNQFAYAAAYAVADNPSFAYNPLVLYGAPGTGKTHLLHAIGHRVLELRPRARIAVVDGAALLAGAPGSEAPRSTSAPAAGATSSGVLRAADVVLVDGLDGVVAAGASAQRHAARMLAGLLDADRQVVLVSGSAPKAMATLDEALRTQLQRGLMAEVGPQEDAGPVAAAHTLPPPISSASPASPAPAAQVAPPEPSVSAAGIEPAAAARAAGMPAAALRQRTGPDQVLAAVSQYFGVALDALLARRRDKETVVPRQVAMYLMREEAGSSLSDIGARLGGRDHSTVLHGCERIAELLASDSRLRADVAAVRASLGLAPGAEWPDRRAAATAAAP